MLPTDVDHLDHKGSEFGSYVLEECVGHGGMAALYKATHQTLMRPCAIKVLSPKMVARDPRYVGMFFSEARSAASASCGPTASALVHRAMASSGRPLL